MKRTKLGLAIASGVMAGALAWAAATSVSPDSYTKIEASSLVSSPRVMAASMAFGSSAA